jgi:hypothetical protein
LFIIGYLSSAVFGILDFVNWRHTGWFNGR